MYEDATEEFDNTSIVVDTECQMEVLDESTFWSSGIFQRRSRLLCDGPHIRLCFLLHRGSLTMHLRTTPFIPSKLRLRNKQDRADKPEELQRQQDHEQVARPQRLKHMARTDSHEGRKTRSR